MSYEGARTHVLNGLPKGVVGAKIGVSRGDFSARILEHAKPKLLHLIDPWVHSDLNVHAQSLYGGAGQPEMEAIREHVLARFAGEIDAGQVRVHHATSAQALPTLSELDFVYVDGDHRFDAVRADLEMSLAALRPGGMICVDDYYAGKWWGDDVIRAVNDFLGTHAQHLEVIFVQQGQVVIRRCK